jgi:hypothetical protein
MKKIYTLFIVALLSMSGYAAVKTTIADGSWFTASNWSPSGVPLLEDTVIINHTITVSGNYVDFGAEWLIVNSGASILCDTTFSLHGNLRLLGHLEAEIFANGDGDSTNIYGTLSGGKFAPGNPYTVNYGSILCDSLILGEDFHNYDLIDVIFITSGGALFINHTGGAIAASDSFISATSLTNESGAIMVIGSLTTDTAILNNGDISADSWTHATGIANGTTGKYCIANCFMNFDEISGTIDVCDATPANFCDINTGTIAGTVTTCAVGSCITNVGIEELEMEATIYPNPTSGLLFISNASAGSLFQLINLNGQIIMSGTLSQDNSTLDLSAFEMGVYFLKIQTSQQVEFLQIIKN